MGISVLSSWTLESKGTFGGVTVGCAMSGIRDTLRLLARGRAVTFCFLKDSVLKRHNIFIKDWVAWSHDETANLSCNPPGIWKYSPMIKTVFPPVVLIGPAPAPNLNGWAHAPYGFSLRSSILGNLRLRSLRS
jgi:hypothetical protein